MPSWIALPSQLQQPVPWKKGMARRPTLRTAGGLVTAATAASTGVPARTAARIVANVSGRPQRVFAGELTQLGGDEVVHVGHLAAQRGLGVSRSAGREEDRSVREWSQALQSATSAPDDLIHDLGVALESLKLEHLYVLGSFEVVKVLPRHELSTPNLRQVGTVRRERNSTNCVGEDKLRMRRLETVHHRVHGERAVDHTRHRADEVRRDERDRPWDTVVADERDMVARHDALQAQPASELERLRVRRLVRDLDAAGGGVRSGRVDEDLRAELGELVHHHRAVRRVLLPSANCRGGLLA